MKNKFFNENTKDQVTIIQRVGIKPHREAEFLETVKDIVQKSRSEEGCLSYNLYQDIEDPVTYIFHQVWNTKEDYNKHKNTSHSKYFMAKKYHLARTLYNPGIFERSDAPFPTSSEGSLVLFAKIKALEGKEKELENILCDLIDPTMAEDGAEHYELHKSLVDSKKFMFHETWTTVPHWDAHMQTEHIAKLLEIIDQYVDGGINVTKTKFVM